MTRLRSTSAFVSGILTLVACGSGAATQAAQSPVREVCEVSFEAPEGFEPLEPFEERYPDRVGIRLGFRDAQGRELHAFAGIPGEFGEGLADAGTLDLAAGRTGQLAGGAHRVWVVTWEEDDLCDPRAVLGSGFDREGFIAALELAGVISA